MIPLVARDLARAAGPAIFRVALTEGIRVTYRLNRPNEITTLAQVRYAKGGLIEKEPHRV